MPCNYQIVPPAPSAAPRSCCTAISTRARPHGRLPKEVDVQNWFVDKLAAMQGYSYSLERGPHVAEEKEPDIRLSSLRDPAAKSPIEIKVAGNCSLKEL